MDLKTACQILNLTENATETQIKASYKELVGKISLSETSKNTTNVEAELEINNLNSAYDVLISYARTGTASFNENTFESNNPEIQMLANIRMQINENKIDKALSELEMMQNVQNVAEWNFLTGTVYYYKGWLSQAHTYFKQATVLSPSNPEYQAALNNLSNSAKGNMQGNPYENNSTSANALNCACNTCSIFCCLDLCCGACRGV